MGYTMLKNKIVERSYETNSLEQAVLSFIRDNCQGLRFDKNKTVIWDSGAPDFEGTSLKQHQIPYNMEKDIDRLCLENALDRFLKSGRKEDAFNVYFCYLEMFVGGYDETRRMIEFLSEFEVSGSGLSMKRRDYYSHSVYVFALGLAIYEANKIYRDAYNDYYQIKDEHEAACHYLQYWGFASLFHDIGYPFELPFEQVASYFEIQEDKRENRPFVAYHALEPYIVIDGNAKASLRKIYGDTEFPTTNELFAHVLAEKLGEDYGFSESQMLQYLIEKPTLPDKSNRYMNYASFSESVLFRKIFDDMNCELKAEHLDALTAILMHNSLYKFYIAHYKGDGNKPLEIKSHPLAYMLMLCDELQCWDRTAYGRNSKKELYPMGCVFDFSNDSIKAVYLFDEKEIAKINNFKDSYIEWLQDPKGEAPKLKAYSEMYIKKDGISSFQKDLERVVDLTRLKLTVEMGYAVNHHVSNKNYLSDSSFISLYNFAMVLNGRWDNAEWKAAKYAGQEEKFLLDEKNIKKFADSFKKLSLEYKLLNMNQAKAFAKYMDEIGCFYTDKAVDFEMLESFTVDELVKIGRLEHQRWLQEHYDMGWIYGNPDKEKRDYLRQHKDMIPDFKEGEFEVSFEQAQVNYDRLDKAEQDKDTDPMECMLAMLRLFDGLRIYRLN